MFGYTPAERTTTATPVTLSGTWFGRMGLRPYELLRPTVPVEPTPLSGRREPLPTRRIAA